MRKDDIIDALEATLIDEDVPIKVRELIMDRVAEILDDELEDED